MFLYGDIQVNWAAKLTLNAVRHLAGFLSANTIIMKIEIISVKSKKLQLLKANLSLKQFMSRLLFIIQLALLKQNKCYNCTEKSKTIQR